VESVDGRDDREARALTWARGVSTLGAPMICRSCHQDAPSFIRGARAYCTACGAPMPLVSVRTAVNVAGQPSKIGGGIAGVLGWLVLTLGALAALIVGGLAQAIFAASAGLWLGGIVGFFTLLVALPLILGGRRLRRSGEETAVMAQHQALLSLAAQRGGVLLARDAARGLAVSEEEADALLTDLVKRSDGRVTLEVDDNGALSYVFTDLVAAPGPRVRVSAQPWRVPAQAPRIIDAELIDEVEEERARPRHMVR
jgi:hypothetical protein